MTSLTTPLHYQIVKGLLENGVCPTNSELAGLLNLTKDKVESGLSELSDIHGVVLHPHAVEPWVIHPFSLMPTLNWIKSNRKGWWAPCIWCALGVASLAKGRVLIQSRLGAESEALEIEVIDGHPQSMKEIVVHFAIPPARAWDNVHAHCSMVLPFRSENEIQRWTQRHSLPLGEAVPLDQVAQLARIWYGRHADADWQKWSVDQAQSIFDQVGLRSDFWNLGSRSGRF